MPFSSFRDPADVARAHSALERAWIIVAPEIPMHSDPTAQRQRLAYIVATYALIALDDDELVQRSVAKFRETV